MRIDSDAIGEEARDQQLQLGGDRDWRVIAGLVVAVAVALGAFVLGRNSASTDRPEPELAAAALVTDVLGEAEVQATVVFADGTKAVLVCSAIEVPDGTRGDMRVIHIGSNGDGERILSYTPLAEVESCQACETEPAQLMGEDILIGECDFNSAGPSPTPFPRRVQTISAFVISAPPASGLSAVGMDLLCGITQLSIEDDQLVLAATQARYAGNPNPPAPLPPMRFTRTRGQFIADDIGVVDHFCAVTPDTQLVDLPPFVFGFDRGRELSHLVIDSDIGKIGFRSAVLVGRTPNQCNVLFMAQIEAMTGGPDAPTLASITGLEPPEGYDDWFFTCQIDSTP